MPSAPPAAPTALIAEDEPLLARALADELARAWPALRVVATVGDGASAVREALALRPEVLFLDIRMPGLGGLDAAAAVAEDWPDGVPLPALVFVTAYERHAVEAFEAEAVDYLLKPVRPERLAKTVARLQAALRARGAPADGGGADRGRPAAGGAGSVGIAEGIGGAAEAGTGVPAGAGACSGADGGAAFAGADDAAADRLRRLLEAQARATAAPAAARPPAAPLRLIPAALPGTAGATVRMVPVDEVLVFEAADKYLRVLTAGGEYLIRTPLRDLQPQLPPEDFWQVHRGTLVRAAAIDTVSRDAAGRLRLSVRGLPERFAVSRLYAARFRAM